MSDIITYGRYPTLGEVRDYYSREDVLGFFLKLCNTRWTVIVIPEKAHWEPDWDHDRICAESVDSLREFLLDRIDRAFPDVSLDERLPFYPSLHCGLDRWPAGEVNGSSVLGRDTVMESDLPTWHESFEDVMEQIERLHLEDVPYRIKFSGRRSLHVLIPYSFKRLTRRTFPDFRGHLAGMVRAPYSLNEDTGMVSLPLTRDSLSSFRPWQANLHLVEVDDAWLTIPEMTESEADEMFKRVRRNRKSVQADRLDLCVDWASLAERAAGIAQRSAHVLRDDGNDSSRPWCALLGGEPMTNEKAANLLTDGDRETRWLTAEAILLQGLVPDHAVIDRLLGDDDLLLRSAALDILIRFPDVAGSYFAQLMQVEHLGSQAHALCLLNVNTRLRDSVFNAMQAVTERTAASTIRLACAAGIFLENWSMAWQIVEDVQDEYGRNAEWKTRVQALRLLEQLFPEWDPNLYGQVGRELANLGVPVLDILLLAYAKPDRRLRQTLLKALAFIGDSSALDIFVRELGSTYHDNTRWATLGLMKIGTPAVPALLEAAQSDEVRIRRYAVRCLGHLNDPRGRDVLQAALDDSDAGVRGQAMEMVIDSVTVEHIPVLRRNLVSYDWDERHVIIDQLRRLGEAGEAAIRDAALIDGDPVAAGQIWLDGDQRGRQVLLNCVKTSHHTGRAIQVLLDSDPDSEVIKHIISASEQLDWWEWRGLYGDMLRRGIPEALTVIEQTRQHPDRLMRRMAAYALRSSNDDRAPELLLSFLTDSDSKVRMTAYESILKKYPDPVAYFEEVAENHESDLVRRAASKSLARYHRHNRD